MSCQESNCEFVKESLEHHILAGFILTDESNFTHIVIRESKEEAETWKVTEVVYPDGEIPPENRHVGNLTSQQFKAIIDCACPHLEQKKMVKHSGIMGAPDVSKLYMEYDVKENERYISHQVDLSDEEGIPVFRQLRDLIYSSAN